MLPSLYGQAELLLREMSKRRSPTARNLVLVGEYLGIARLWTGMGEKKRFQIVVNGMTDEDAIFEEVRNFLLNFFKRSGCREITLGAIRMWMARGDVPCTISDGLMPENSVR